MVKHRWHFKRYNGYTVIRKKITLIENDRLFGILIDIRQDLLHLVVRLGFVESTLKEEEANGNEMMDKS